MKEYKVVYNCEGEAFDEGVSQLLNDGWELYGNPWSHLDEASNLVYIYQAIKRDITYLIVEEDNEEAEESSEEKKDSKEDKKD